MSLSNYPVGPQIAISDIDRAAAFYEGVLGLVPTGPQHEKSRTYECGDGTFLNV